MVMVPQERPVSAQPSPYAPMRATAPTSHEGPLHVLLGALLQQQLVLQLALQVLNLLPARHQTAAQKSGLSSLSLP
jgi:hypothetical protein